ncbi:SRPBCC domain-containing protein [Merismopedia glauca]|uniref:SRPBCC domain-containing protein n=1 Tax=Merismopedia glauca CCAP 1448/3 TaxID=1296344 RepID=A0A2T1C6P6_9CYAN|nr:SRPBCC domain-containing protein [Merismopedia glauca]PSB03931.1 SRPBCC domain-containing protein [Merismopedia glauca CCAP 1448/3]
MLEVYTEITIDAPLHRVWDNLINFSQYPQWNPFLINAKGEIKVGSQLQITAQPPGFKRMTMNPTIVKVENCQELRWKGKVIAPGILDGEHIFKLEEVAPHRTKLIQQEFYSGLLVLLMAKKLKTNSQKGFELMNQSLKKLSET